MAQSLTHLMNKLMTSVFVEQPLASTKSSSYTNNITGAAIMLIVLTPFLIYTIVKKLYKTKIIYKMFYSQTHSPVQNLRSRVQIKSLCSLFGPERERDREIER